MKHKAVVESCDNPDCSYEEIVTKEEPARGYHLGKGFWSLGGGGPIPAVYAHSKECIVPAIEAKIEETR